MFTLSDQFCGEGDGDVGGDHQVGPFVAGDDVAAGFDAAEEAFDLVAAWIVDDQRQELRLFEVPSGWSQAISEQVGRVSGA